MDIRTLYTLDRNKKLFVPKNLTGIILIGKFEEQIILTPNLIRAKIRITKCRKLKPLELPQKLKFFSLDAMGFTTCLQLPKNLKHLSLWEEYSNDLVLNKYINELDLKLYSLFPKLSKNLNKLYHNVTESSILNLSKNVTYLFLNIESQTEYLILPKNTKTIVLEGIAIQKLVLTPHIKHIVMWLETTPKNLIFQKSIRTINLFLAENNIYDILPNGIKHFTSCNGLKYVCNNLPNDICTIYHQSSTFWELNKPLQISKNLTIRSTSEQWIVNEWFKKFKHFTS